MFEMPTVLTKKLPLLKDFMFKGDEYRVYMLGDKVMEVAPTIKISNVAVYMYQDDNMTIKVMVYCPCENSTLTLDGKEYNDLYFEAHASFFFRKETIEVSAAGTTWDNMEKDFNKEMSRTFGFLRNFL